MAYRNIYIITDETTHTILELQPSWEAAQFRKKRYEEMEDFKNHKIVIQRKGLTE